MEESAPSEDGAAAEENQQSSAGPEGGTPPEDPENAPDRRTTGSLPFWMWSFAVVNFDIEQGQGEHSPSPVLIWALQFSKPSIHPNLISIPTWSDACDSPQRSLQLLTRLYPQLLPQLSRLF